MSDRKTGYSPLNAKKNRDVINDVVFAYVHTKWNILHSVLHSEFCYMLLSIAYLCSHGGTILSYRVACMFVIVWRSAKMNRITEVLQHKHGTFCKDLSLVWGVDRKIRPQDHFLASWGLPGDARLWSRGRILAHLSTAQDELLWTLASVVRRPSIHTFERLLLCNPWVNFLQTLCGALCSRWIVNLYKWSRFVNQAELGWILIFSIKDSRSTKFVQMMTVSGPLIFLRQSRICVRMHLNRANVENSFSQNAWKTNGWNLQCVIKVVKHLSYNQNFVPWWLLQNCVIFKCLLLWNCLSNFHQISHVSSVKRVMSICLNGSAQLNKMAAMSIYGKNSWKCSPKPRKL